ncbi:MAG: hypothetical protein LBC96_05970 [Lachnospiraceae bacterium]|jgi:hypothetical protein|nr:hypothetical protein [Lachnospiraceae bacterium]
MELKDQSGFFMTKIDEDVFCNVLRKEFPNIMFLDVKPTFEGNIDKRSYKSTSESDSTSFSIVNFDLIKKNNLKNNFAMYSGYYHFSSVGIGQMQFLGCDVYPKNSKNLRVGRISNTWGDNINDEQLKWHKMVYKLLKKNGHKIHWYYIDNNEPKIVEKPDNKVVAYDDAIKKYNGINNNFMYWDSARFIDKK